MYKLLLFFSFSLWCSQLLGQIKEVTDILSLCAETVVDDNNDVRKFGLSQYIHSNLECAAKDRQNKIHSFNFEKVSEFKKNLKESLKEINKAHQDQSLAEQFQDYSLAQSVLSYWLLQKKYFTFNKDTAIKEICSVNSCNIKQRTLLKQLLKNSISYIDNEKPVSEMEIIRNISKQFLPLTGNLNKICKEASKDFKKAQVRFDCLNISPLRLTEEPSVTPYQPVKITSTGECNSRTKKRILYERKLLNTTLKKMREAYFYLSKAPQAEILVTKSLRKQFPYPTNSIIQESCFRGKTDIYKAVYSSTIKRGLKELSSSIKNEIRHNLSPIKASKELVRDKLKSDPLIAAKVLNRNKDPKMAKLICHHIRSINRLEFRWNMLEKASLTTAGIAATVLSLYTGGYSLILLDTLMVSSGIAAFTLDLKEDKLRRERSLAQQASATSDEDLIRSINNLNQLDQNISITNRVKKMTILFAALDALTYGAASKMIVQSLNKSLIGTRYFKANPSILELKKLARRSKAAIKFLRTLVNKGILKTIPLQRLSNQKIVQLALRLKTIKENNVNLTDIEIVKKVNLTTTNHIINKSLTESIRYPSP